MKVSVIMRTYNRGYILREAIESVLKQTYRDFEIIVVDDGSTDNTSEVVASYEHLELRYLRHARNRGVGAACNTGIEASTGELVTFLDSDDLWKPDNLERQVDFLVRHPEVDAVFCDSLIALEPEPIPSIVRRMKRFPSLLENRGQVTDHILTSRQMYLCLLEEVPIKPSGLVIKRVMFEKTGMFDESWRSGEDWEFFLRLSRFARFGYIDSPLIIQRRTPDATHKKYQEVDRLFLLKLFANEKRTLRDDPVALEAVKRGISAHCKSLAGLYLQSGRRKESVAVYLQGFRESRNPDMLLRAASVFLPARLRSFLVRTFMGRRGSTATEPIDWSLTSSVRRVVTSAECSQMKVSVIIRTYNRGYILSEAIESALTQTHRNIEILVVDDGSTDETMEVVKRFQDKRVRYLRHDGNRGVGAACNTGIAAATGDAVAFLDTDDLWKPEMLERLVSYLFSHPELGAVFCDVEIMNARGVTPSTTRLMHSFPKLLRRVQGDGEYLLSSRGMYVCLLEEVPIKMIAVLLRRLVFDKVGAFNEGGRSGEDWEFFIRLSRCTSFGYIDAPLAIQRVSADATHTKYREEDKTFLLDFCGGKRAVSVMIWKPCKRLNGE